MRRTSTHADERQAARWEPTEGRANPLFGAGATRVEQALASGAGLLGALLVTGTAAAQASGWSGVQYAVAAVVAFDVVGGVIANGLGSAKRDHFGPPAATARTTAGRVARTPVLFTALHVHPVVVALVYDPAAWWWGVAWYLVTLVGTTLVRVSALYLQRPVALAWCALAALGASFLPSPAHWGWLPVALALKLVLAHAVQEEAYRPAAVGSVTPRTRLAGSRPTSRVWGAAVVAAALALFASTFTLPDAPTEPVRTDLLPGTVMAP